MRERNVEARQGVGVAGEKKHVACFSSRAAENEFSRLRAENKKTFVEEECPDLNDRQELNAPALRFASELEARMEPKSTAGKRTTKRDAPARFLSKGAVMALRHALIDRKLNVKSMPVRLEIPLLE